jgi:hypothetical protein
MSQIPPRPGHDPRPGEGLTRSSRARWLAPDATFTACNCVAFAVILCLGGRGVPLGWYS